MAKSNPWWREYFIYDVVRALTPGTGVAYDLSVVRIDSDSNFEFIKTTYVATSDNILLRYRDDSTGRYLMKTGIDVKACAGRNTLPMGLSNAFIPFVWPRPHVIAAGANFTVEASDYSAVANTLRLSFHGAKIRPGTAPWNQSNYYAEVPALYSFTAGRVNVAALATTVQRIEIDMDADFLVQKITGTRTGDALITVTESARGRDWMNSAVHIDNLIGNGSFPNILPANRFLLRGSVLVVNIQNLLGIQNTIDICLSGVKLYA
ncbi:MAG: hypothetical protein ABIG95_02475 [Candidatus Woesearchaeota archaeon]